jgi:hypothetical protein
MAPLGCIVSAYGRRALHEIALSDSEGGCFIALSAQLLDLACDPLVVDLLGDVV